MPHYVYILQNLKDNRYYIGETSDRQDRRFIMLAYSDQQEIEVHLFSCGDYRE
jgi:predicted GIY-YIG superfamily endonuclease